MLSSKTGATVTVAIIGPYNWLPDLVYDGFQVVGGLDKLNITALSDMSNWNCDSWWYWNQKAIEIAVKNINNSPLILPNVTIEIKRFNDNDKPVCFENPGYAIATAYDIVTNFPDVIGVMGDLGSLETLADAEVYGLNDIPICTGSEYHQRFWKSSNYPTYFQMFGYTGFAESIALLLKKWNVNRVAVLSVQPCAPTTSCGYIMRVFHAQGFTILAQIVTSKSSLDYIANTLSRVDARYMVFCGASDTLGEIYYALASKNQSVGPGYVWLLEGPPAVSSEAVELYGHDYFKLSKGVLTPQGQNIVTDYMSNLTNTVYEQILAFQAPWGSAFSLLEMEGWFNIQQMYDCVGVFAAGLDNLLKRKPSFTPEMLASRQLNRLMNRTLFADTGYRGMLGDPVRITANGDLAASWNFGCVDGLTPDLNQIIFAETDLNVSSISYINEMQPTFFDGTNTPPPDGPAYTDITITLETTDGTILLVFFGVGLILTLVSLMGVILLRTKQSVRSGSIVFLVTLIAGSAPSFVSNITYLGVPTPMLCQTRIWLQLISYAVMVGSMLCRNFRTCLIYKAKVMLPNYMLRDGIWVSTLGLFVVGEIVILCVWSHVSEIVVEEVLLPGYFVEYECVYGDERGYAVGAALWVYNVLLLPALYLATHLSSNLSPIHSEFTMLLVVSMCLTISAILVPILDKSEKGAASQLRIAGLVFANTSIPLLMQIIPRSISLVSNEEVVVSSILSAVRGRASSKRNSSKLPNAVRISTQHRSIISETNGSIATRKEPAYAKFSLPFEVVYKLGEYRKWEEGIVIVAFVRRNLFLQLLPQSCEDLFGTSVAVTLDPRQSMEKLVACIDMECNGIRTKRVECLTINRGVLVIDFGEEPSRAEFVHSLTLAIKCIQ